ncbi:hypothetical protein Tcan_01843 [Toxocara canis]|uniref:Uncharacterized protein n=1 Tax=Toxocara canis TaxID=6265 RepID=A0A0B2UZK4_TOXCA|nr:hypothetical protein Tcan_01843 [Toxocara canis]
MKVSIVHISRSSSPCRCLAYERVLHLANSKRACYCDTSRYLLCMQYIWYADICRTQATIMSCQLECFKRE